jgi:hypothetical protein
LGVGQFVIGAAFAPLVGAFGTHTAVPMVAVIATFCVAAAALAGMLVASGRSPGAPARLEERGASR